jgi:hypothetical protein
MVLDVSFFDEDGTAVTPSAATWTLTDDHGSVINSRSAVSETPASTVTIVLSGADLAASDPLQLNRRLLIEWTYNSTAGTGLPGKHEASFDIDDLVAVV